MGVKLAIAASLLVALGGAGSRDSYRDLCGYAALAADMAEDDGGKKA